MSMVMPAEDLRDELLEFCDDVDLPDDRLNCCPTVEWLQRFGEFCRWMWGKVSADRMARRIPQSESNDCDDAAGRAVAWAREARDQSDELVRLGVGFAVFLAYVTIREGECVNGITGDGRMQHRICIVRTPDGWMAFEPQTGSHERLESALDRCALWRVRMP